MGEAFDIVVRNAKTLLYPEKLVDMGIKNGTIAKISGEVGKGKVELDAKGNLVTESFVNPQLHMCKVFTREVLGEQVVKLAERPDYGAASAMVELASMVKDKKKYHESWIYDNAKRALMLGLRYGVLHYRVFVDTDTRAKLEAVKALTKLRDEFKDVADLQVVAFPQDGILRDPGSEEYVRKAVEMGADLVGGFPWYEYTDEDSRKHIDMMFDIAKEYNKDVAMLTDMSADPTLKTTEMLAVKTIREGWIGRVQACHALALMAYPSVYFSKVTALLKQAGMSVTLDPHTSYVWTKARVSELTKGGVTLALGQDDIMDTWYPYGRNSMLEVAFLASHIIQDQTIAGMELLYDMITKNGAKTMGLKGYGMEKGCQANLVVLNTQSIREAMAYQDVPSFVISRGKIIVKNESKTTYKL